LIPFFTFLMTTGQYVLQINTLPGEMNISTNINAVSSVPLPGALWLFGSALVGFLGFTNRRKLSS
jgi:PEP-CTERM motif